MMFREDLVDQAILAAMLLKDMPALVYWERVHRHYMKLTEDQRWIYPPLMGWSED